ncbi:MAG TPA: magnesium transporter [Candidatus Limnocylindrales bacterium]|jgi:magnesium transporter|nr:magnesium transporter [Candidatus Limnocylindrales bacterium]
MTTQATADLLAEVQALIHERERDGVLGMAELIGPAEWADLVPQLEPTEVAVLIQWLPDDEIAAILEELPPSEAARILRTLSANEAAPLLGEMDPDDAADVVEQLPDETATAILVRMSPAEAAEIRELSAYEPDSAGGIMTPAFVAVSKEATAAQATAAIRRLVDEAETVNYVYVVDDERHLLGVLSLYRLLLSPVSTPVEQLMAPSTVRVRASADQETAARLLTDRNLLAIPVVDDDDHLVGIITEDDVADVLQAEATEDIERLGGSQPLNLPYRLASVPLLVRKRVGWLLLLFLAEAYTGTVLRNFEDELSAVVDLAFFIPLLIGTGGNLGSQTVTLVVRAMALGEVALKDIAWVVWKELRVGLVMGLAMAAVAFGRALILNVRPGVPEVVALTILAICLWAAVIAGALPLILRRVGVDPAVVSSPLIATLVDGTGLVIYFTIAKFVLAL